MRTPFDHVEPPKTERSKPERTIQSLDRAMDILQALFDAGGELALKDISREVGLSKSTCHGLLATMERRGYVGQAPSGAYTLGLKLAELGTKAVDRLDLRAQAHDLLRDLAAQFKETVHLVTRDGSYVIYIDKVESEHSVRTVSQVGKRLPAVCTGVGKAVLANLPAAELESILQNVTLTAYTRNTITDVARFREHLAEVRRQGWAMDDEEITEGLRCVAAPIFDHTGACVGSLSISAPSVRMGPSRVTEMIGPVSAAAHQVSLRMGYHVSPQYRTQHHNHPEEG